MYSRRLASLFYLAVALFFTCFISSASAYPAFRSLGELVSWNQNRACRLGACYIEEGKNGTQSANATTSPVESNSTTAGAPAPPAENGALSMHPNVIIVPAMMASTSLLLLL